MEEKYNTLSLVQLREIVKAQGIKNTSIMRKAQLVQILCDLEEKANAEKAGSDSTNTEKNGSVDTYIEKASTEKAGPAGEYTEKASTEKVGSDGESTEKASREKAGSDSEYTEKASREKAGPDSENTEKLNIEKAGLDGENTDRAYTERQRTDKRERPRDDRSEKRPNLEELDSGQIADGILEVMSDGFGFIRCENYLPGDNDIYVSPAQIRRFNLKTGDIIEGNIKIKTPTEKFSALLYVKKVNGFPPSEAVKRKNFEDMTPIFPNSRIRLENPKATVPMRIVDLVSPIGRGQRGMIVSPPKTGKTTLLKQIAKSINYNYPEMNMIILLIDERPEEVTDIKEYIEGENVEVIYSTFDELPEHHKRVSEMVLERAKRLVEHKKDVVILLDSITRLARAYNLTVPPSGRTLSGGLDPAALHMPKRFFGAARNMREGGSLTVLATALVETGSKMDDVVFEEFKGTGNMELVLDRKLSEKRIFPAIDIPRSGTRREELLLDREEMDAMYMMRKALNGMKSDEALEHILDMFMRTKNNKDFIANIKRTKII